MKREVARISPGDVDGYERFMRHSEAIFRIGFEQLAHVLRLSPGYGADVAVDLVRLRGDRSVYATAARFVSHPYLRFA